jgi:predicted permease
MEPILRTCRHGWRGLRRDPRFAILAMATLGLGVGLSTAVFSVANTLLLRGLPVVDQDRLVVLFGATRDGRIPNYPIGVADADDFAGMARSLEAVAYHTYEGAAPRVIREGDHVSRLRRSLVTGGFFDVLGAQPVLGRSLRPEDDVPGAARVVVLAHRTWQDRYGADPSVIGRGFQTYEDNETHTIVGVMPPGLDFPRGTDFWTPVMASTSAANLPFVGLQALARLRPGATSIDAREDIAAFFTREGAPVWQRDLIGRSEELVRFHLGDVRPALLAFIAAVALLLVITCVNLATLLLVRSASRARQVAVRMALGARRIEAVGPMIGESVLVAVGGLILGLAVATLSLAGIARYAPVDLAALGTMAMSGPSYLAAALVTGAATLAFTLGPAWLTARLDPQAVLKAASRSGITPRSRLLPDLLVAGQVAIAIAVVAVAGVIGRSLINLERADLAFDPSRLVVAELAIRFDRSDSRAGQQQLMEELTARVSSVPGVVAASPVVAVPFSGSAGWDGRPATESQTMPEAASNPILNLEIVAPPYFATIGVPIELGRGFTDADRENAPRVTVVSRSAALLYWPDVPDPLGRRLRIGAQGEFDYTVVGVVPDTRYRDLREARPTMYVPMRQNFAPFPPTSLLIRTSLPPGAVTPALRGAIEEAPGVALVAATSFDVMLARPLAQPRLNAFVLALFALSAAGLAAIGIFGVTSAAVRRRLREIGIRMAVGATARSIARLVLRRALVVTLAGSLAGVLIALAVSRVTAAMVYAVAPADPLTIAGGVAVLLFIALIAAMAPARAAARIDPVTVLAADE